MGLLERVVHAANRPSVDRRPARGLLVKAVSLRGADAALEAAFVERVKRLPLEESTPFTALSLLKAFQPFSAGLCLVLQEDNFECVTAVGVESAAESIPTATLFPPMERGPRRIGAAGDFGIASASPEAEAWAFPVAPGEPPYETALVLVEEPGVPLAVASLSRVISACSEHFSPKPAHTEPTADGLTSFLSSFLDRSPCQLIILEREGGSNLAKEAAAAIASLGSSFALSSSRALIAIPAGRDRELLAHRLAKSLSARATAGTEAANLEAAQEFLKAFT